MRVYHLLPLVSLAACARMGSDACALSDAGPGWLAFASQRTGDFEIWVARTDGGCQQRLTDAPSSVELHPSWSRNGRIAFTSDRSGASRIRVHDLATGAEAELDTGALRASSPAFSPDGATLAFEGRAGASTADVYVIDAAGGAPLALTSDAADDAGPAWSPDGQTVYFVSSRSGQYEIWSVPAGGGAAATKLTTTSRIIGRPAAGSGGRVYFARTKAGSTETEVVRRLADGTIEVLSSQGDSEPAVSADGARVAMRTFRYGAANAEVVAADEGDGGNAARLTDDPASDGAPCFAPGP